MYHYYNHNTTVSVLQPGEEHDNQQRRATDRVWSKKTYRLREVVEDLGNRMMYYLSDGPERAFVSEELMLIPEDIELPPDYVQNWQYLSSWIDIICKKFYFAYLDVFIALPSLKVS